MVQFVSVLLASVSVKPIQSTTTMECRFAARSDEEESKAWWPRSKAHQVDRNNGA